MKLRLVPVDAEEARGRAVIPRLMVVNHKESGWAFMPSGGMVLQVQGPDGVWCDMQLA
jgi:hypothetical protein